MKIEVILSPDRVQQCDINNTGLEKLHKKYSNHRSESAIFSEHTSRP